MTLDEFGQHIKSKYPEYNDLDNTDLANKVLTKYPEYKDMVDSSANSAPGTLESGALGLMSGVPGAETVVSGIKSLGKETYPEAHQELETLKNQAWEGHPIAYGAGKATGIVGTGLLAPEVEGLSGAAALGAGIGAASGADTASSPSDIATNALKGAGTGAALGAVGQGIGNAVGAIPGAAKSMLASTGEKTSLADIEAYLQNPNAIRTALSKEGLANQVASTTSDIGKASGYLSQEARSALNPGNSVLSSKDLKDVAMDAASKYYTEGNPATAADQTSINAIVDQYQKLAQIAESNDGQIPETTLRSMIDRMQSATKDSTFGNPDAGAAQTALKEFSGKLNDALRQANPDYAEQMAPSAEAANLSKNLSSKFGIENGQPTDVTSSRIGQIGKEGKLEGEDLLNQAGDLTGQNLQNMVENARIKGNLEAPGPGGALKTLMSGIGYGVGKMTGVPFGGIGGAAAGRYSSEALNGGSIAKQIMDSYLALGNTPMAQGASEAIKTFGPILTNAAKVGGNQLAATHFVLATSNPQYQQLIEHVQNQGPQ